MIERRRRKTVAESDAVEANSRPALGVFNIRGAEGSGRPEFVRQLMEWGRATPIQPEGHKRPEAYELRINNVEQPLFLIGPYHRGSSCGLDAIPTDEERVALLDKYAGRGHVAFESAGASTAYGEVEEWLAARGGTMCFLGTPKYRCLARAEANAKGPFDPDRIAKDWDAIDDLKRRLPSLSGERITVVEINMNDMYDAVLSLWTMLEAKSSEQPAAVIEVGEPAKLPAVGISPSTSVAVAAVGPPIDYIDYDEAVVEGQAIVSRQSRDHWRLGELADRIEKKYGDNTLSRFAAAIAVPVKTLERHRDVYRAWKEIPAPGRESLPYAVARELAAHPDRVRIVIDKPGLTKRLAAEIMQAYRASQKQDAAPTDETPAITPAVPTKTVTAGKIMLEARRMLGTVDDWRRYRGPVDDGLVGLLTDLAEAVAHRRDDFAQRLADRKSAEVEAA